MSAVVKVVPLTEREHQMLLGIVAGLTNGQIGRQHHLAEDTVKKHIRHLFRKLGVSSRTQAALVAYEQGLIGQSATRAARELTELRERLGTVLAVIDATPSGCSTDFQYGYQRCADRVRSALGVTRNAPQGVRVAAVRQESRR